MVDNLLPEHVELPHVLDLAVHLVQLTTWGTFSLEHSFMVKSYRWGGWVAHVIIVSPQSQLDLDFALGLGLGLRGPDLGLGLDNSSCLITDLPESLCNTQGKETRKIISIEPSNFYFLGDKLLVYTKRNTDRENEAIIYLIEPLKLVRGQGVYLGYLLEAREYSLFCHSFCYEICIVSAPPFFPLICLVH